MVGKWIYGFDELAAAEAAAGGSWDGARGLLGGKGANLADMTRIGVPVPPGFTVTTAACNAFLAAGERFPAGLWEEERAALGRLESQTGKRFGDAANPLLVSCRSGAKFSMPGMMDTVLNIGMNDAVAEGLARMTGDPRFAYDSYRRLVQMFGSVVMGIADEPFEEVLTAARRRAGVEIDSDLTADDWRRVTAEFKAIFARETGEDFPQDPTEQIRLATEAVFKSWNGKRAVDYRNAAKIAHDLGTAVNICTMVFGNLGNDSATGVAMTRSGASGENQIEGDYLTNAQGEDVVAGIRLTKPIEQLREEMPAAYAEFAAICRKLELHYKEMQDVEFTVERGKLWMLQTRDAKRTAQATVRIAVDMVEEGLITREQAVLRVTPDHVDFFLHPAVRQGDGEAGGRGAGPDRDGHQRLARRGRRPDRARRRHRRAVGQAGGQAGHHGPARDQAGRRARHAGGAQGILTSRGGTHQPRRARRAAVRQARGGRRRDARGRSRGARDPGRPTGCSKEGDWVSVDGTIGRGLRGQARDRGARHLATPT